MPDYRPLFKQAIPELNSEQQGVFALLLDTLIETNKVMNLTAVTDPAVAVRTHFADSIALVHALQSMGDSPEAVQTAADVGAGAGFPTLPCAVLMPNCMWYPVESIAKKSRFTADAAKLAKLNNVHPLAVRGEELGATVGTEETPGREQYDLVTARALAAVPTLLEVMLPLAKIGGLLALFKTTNTPEELAQLNKLAPMLGGTVLEPYRYRFAGDRAERLIVRIRKTSPTSEKYPRRNGVPFKKPLT